MSISTEMQDKITIAYALYYAGFKPTYSSDLEGFYTAGYGELDSYGDWQYPLVMNSKDNMDDSCWSWSEVKDLLID